MESRGRVPLPDPSKAETLHSRHKPPIPQNFTGTAMKKALVSLVFLSHFFGVTAFAADNELPPLTLEDAFFGQGANPPLTKQEQEALALARKWQSDNTTTLKPVQGPDGSVRFLFGAQQPSIVCGVFQVTDVELEPGEIVNSPASGRSGALVGGTGDYRKRSLTNPASCDQTSRRGVGNLAHGHDKPPDVSSSLEIPSLAVHAPCGLHLSRCGHGPLGKSD